MIDKLTFPDDSDLKPAVWYPIYFRANFDTPERLVAGIVAKADGKWHLQSASALERLRCLYSNDANVAIDVIEAGLRDLESKLSTMRDLSSEALSVSGLTIGDPREAHARSAQELATRWLRLISSLHDARKEISVPLGIALASCQTP